MKNSNEGWKCSYTYIYLIINNKTTNCIPEHVILHRQILFIIFLLFIYFFVKLHHTEENKPLRSTLAKDPNRVSSLWCFITHYCPCYLVRRPLSHFGSVLKEKNDNVTDLPTLLTGPLIEQIPYCAFRGFILFLLAFSRKEAGLRFRNPLL